MVTAGGKRKQVTISISSSEESESESESESVSVSKSGEESDGDHEDGVLSRGGSSSDDDDEDYEDGDEDSDDEDSEEERATDEELFNKVINFLERRKDLHLLKLDECKAYLRKYQLRMSGAKAICIERILEHWRIKDGNGEKLYPKSSFCINCTGDVCKGDVILFKQRVYEKFDIVRRGGGGKIIGKRVIAARVVKESYGAAKQQHTFTVEILWSKGAKPLPPLHPLLVKGRNLYRLKTFRQHWSNETERSKVLSEKHNRGAMARHVRAIAKARSANRASKKISSSQEPLNKQRKEELKLSKKMKTTHNVRAKSDGLAAGSSTAHPERSNYFDNRIHVHPRSSVVHPERSSYETGINMMAHPEQLNYYRNGFHAQPRSSITLLELPSYNENGIHNLQRSSAAHPNRVYNNGKFVHPPLPQWAPHYFYSKTASERVMFHQPSFASFAGGGMPHHQHMLGRDDNYIGNQYVNSTSGFQSRQDSAFNYGVPGRQYPGWRGP